MLRKLRQAHCAGVLALALTSSQWALGHGGVVAEEDVCLLKMG